MRIVLTNFGTTGDVQPLLALGVELLRHNHEAVLAFTPEYASRARQVGLDFYPIETHLQNLQREVNAALIEQPELSYSVEEMRRLFAPLASGLPPAFEQLRDACSDADVLVSGPAQPAARMVHETTGIPFVSVQFSHFGGVGSPALQQASASVINPFRARLGLPALRDPLTIDANSPQLALYAMSPHVCAPPADWPLHYRMTGYFFLDDEGWTPDDRLIEFIENGEPPAVITFGSMASAHRDTEASIAVIIDAINKLGCRCILQVAGLDSSDISDNHNVYIVGYVPHGWLFQRASCIVHHGGGGTTGAVFRSGVPSVFVPHGTIFDQHYWAQLACELGCACPPIPFSELTAQQLHAAIKTIMTTPSYGVSAASLGEKIRSEHGAKNARELIEELVYKIGLQQDHSRLIDREIEPGRLEARTTRRREYQKRQRSRSKPDGL